MYFKYKPEQSQTVPELSAQYFAALAIANLHTPRPGRCFADPRRKVDDLLLLTSIDVVNIQRGVSGAF